MIGVGSHSKIYGGTNMLEIVLNTIFNQTISFNGGTNFCYADILVREKFILASLINDF